MSEKDYVKELNETIAFLESDNGQLHDETAEVLREFAACQTAKERNDWISAQSRSPNGSRKLRTIAVKELYDHGIHDYQTLSLMNKLVKSVVASLLYNLVGTLARYNANQLRRSFELSTLSAMVLKNIPKEEQVRLPVLPPAQ